jgi:hypothetical protein
MLMKKKPLATVIIGKMSGPVSKSDDMAGYESKEDVPKSEEEVSDYDAACLECAEMVLAAIEASDAEAFHKSYAAYHDLLHEKEAMNDEYGYSESDS